MFTLIDKTTNESTFLGDETFTEKYTEEDGIFAIVKNIGETPIIKLKKGHDYVIKSPYLTDININENFKQ